MHLTDTIIKRLPTPERGDRKYYDETVKGFGVRVTKLGVKSFILNYRRKSDGRERRLTIGSFPAWTAVAAREEAKRLKRAIDGGADPLGEQEALRGSPTVSDLAKRFLDEHLPRKRPATQRDYKRQIKNIVAALGDRKVAAVGFGDVDKLHQDLSKVAPVQANRTIALLSCMFGMSIRWNMRLDNPCKGVERNPEVHRERFLSEDELARLAAALDALPDKGAANAIRLMLLSGARRGETLKARWSDFDLAAGVWSKPAPTTKSGKTHRIPLSQAACQLLKDMRESAPLDASYLFPPPKGKTAHRLNLNHAWRAVRTAAGIPDVRKHDLRHSFASILASEGLSLLTIGALIGHSSPTSTARYSHLVDSALRAATQKAADVITRARPSGKVVRLK